LRFDVRIVQFPRRGRADFCQESYLAMALHVFCEFGITQKVPVSSSISYDDLAADSDLDKEIIMRFVKTAASHHYFHEPEPGRVSHTVASKLLATEEGMRSFLWQRVDEQMPMTGKAVAALKQDPSTPQENAFKLTHGHHFYAPVGDRTRRFGHLMRSVTTGPEVASLTTAYDWGSFADIVDMGGGMGHIAIAIAAAHPNVTCVVQDVNPGLQTAFEGQLLAQDADGAKGLRERVKFEVHDIFTPQPVKGASVYFLRNVLHNYTDTDCQRILTEIAVSMTPTSKIIIVDALLPEHGTVDRLVEAKMRSLDLMMWGILGAKERDLGMWEQVVEGAEKKLFISQIIGPPKMSRDALIELSLC